MKQAFGDNPPGSPSAFDQALLAARLEAQQAARVREHSVCFSHDLRGSLACFCWQVFAIFK